jgi:hypothetical protein
MILFEKEPHANQFGGTLILCLNNQGTNRNIDKGIMHPLHTLQTFY